MKKDYRLKDFVNIKENEVRYSIFFAFCFVVLLVYLDFYDDFSYFSNNASGIYTCIIGAMIGVLGFSLSGIALISGLFPSSIVDKIDKDNGDGSLKYLLSSYVFLAKNVAIQSVTLIAIYFCTFSKKPKVVEWEFWIIVLFELYHICFIIFYTVSLVSNCVKLYEIKNIYEHSLENEITIREKVVNLQIDFIISTLANITKVSTDKAIESLFDFLEDANPEDKEEILKYLTNYYKK